MRPNSNKASCGICPNSLFPPWTRCAAVVGCLFCMTKRSALAQDALYSFADENGAAKARTSHGTNAPYSIRYGDWRFLVEPEMTLAWNDNVNTLNGNPEGDLIFAPSVNLGASYPVTEYNVLNVTANVGYQAYLRNSQNDSLIVQSGSEAAFDMFIKDFRLTLYDRANYTEDTASQSLLAGSGIFGGLLNDAGLSGSWEMGEYKVDGSFTQ